jgi:hypothetical protein
MQLRSYVIFILLITISAPSLAAGNIFGDEFMESCGHGAIDAQLKNGIQAVKPARASIMCLCLRGELNKTVVKEDMDSALKGNSEQLDAKMNAAIMKCAVPNNSNAEKMNKAENHKPSSNWVRIGGNSDDGYSDYVNRDSIRKDESGLVRLWARREYAKLQKSPNGSNYSSDEFSIAANCQDFTVAVTAGGMYDKKSNLVQKFELKRSEWSFHEATPDSLQGVILKNHCT